jgi:hypothetical protein
MALAGGSRPAAGVSSVGCPPPEISAGEVAIDAGGDRGWTAEAAFIDDGEHVRATAQTFLEDRYLEQIVL